MNAICVDDEAHVLKHTVSACQKIRLLDHVIGFTRPQEALEYVMSNQVDLALLDIDMPNMSGLELAEKMKRLKPQLSVIFITAFSQYALDAFAVHPVSYLLKPVDQARLAKEVEYALSIRASKTPSHITMQTFGHFEVLVDGKTLDFRRSKA
ncbi:MAG: response regulator, partial [Clostridia bacterium]|nr:response regulator [Clostridia bacterium]